jgi:hypothetical protein
MSVVLGEVLHCSSSTQVSTVHSLGKCLVWNHDSVNVQSMCEWKLEIEMCVLDSGVNVLRCRVVRRRTYCEFHT